MNPDQPPTLAHALRFTHEAMNTTFAFHFRGLCPSAAPGIARLCGERLDTLESLLSRFRDGSDVWRINHLRRGESTRISPECHECLLLAMDIHLQSGGLFDVTLGARSDHRRKGGKPEQAPEIQGSLAVHPDEAAVTCLDEGRSIDLGGIGKGFALDQLRLLLDDWEIEKALLCAGSSTLLAFGGDPWPVEFRGDRDSLRLDLRDAALSASGTGIQGDHILHPAGPLGMPEDAPRRVWLTATSAAVADAWSTAVMLMSMEECGEILPPCPQILSAHRESQQASIEAIFQR